MVWDRMHGNSGIRGILYAMKRSICRSSRREFYVRSSSMAMAAIPRSPLERGTARSTTTKLQREGYGAASGRPRRVSTPPRLTEITI